MSSEIRRTAFVREATPEEKERHRTIREEVERELPELKHWAREAAARHSERVAVGTVFTSEEAVVVDAIDEYAAKHDLRAVAVPSYVRPWCTSWVFRYFPDDCACMVRSKSEVIVAGALSKPRHQLRVRAEARRRRTIRTTSGSRTSR